MSVYECRNNFLSQWSQSFRTIPRFRRARERASGSIWGNAPYRVKLVGCDLGNYLQKGTDRWTHTYTHTHAGEHVNNNTTHATIRSVSRRVGRFENGHVSAPRCAALRSSAAPTLGLWLLDMKLDEAAAGRKEAEKGGLVERGVGRGGGPLRYRFPRATHYMRW